MLLSLFFSLLIYFICLAISPSLFSHTLKPRPPFPSYRCASLSFSLCSFLYFASSIYAARFIFLLCPSPSKYLSNSQPPPSLSLSLPPSLPSAPPPPHPLALLVTLRIGYQESLHPVSNNMYIGISIINPIGFQITPPSAYQEHIHRVSNIAPNRDCNRVFTVFSKNANIYQKRLNRVSKHTLNRESNRDSNQFS